MVDFVSRVIQLDAITLDDEFFKLIRGLLSKVATKLTLDQYLSRYSSEFDVFLKFVIWKYTTYRRHCTVGQKLLGVKFEDNRDKLRTLFLVEAIIPYVFKKTAKYLKLDTSLKWPEDILRACQIINFCLFLVTNRYPTLSLRLCSLRIISAYKKLHPSIGYSYHVRELLWHQFADFLMIVIPLINVHRIKGYLRNWRGGASASEQYQEINQLSTSITSSTRGRIVTKCCHCGEDAIIPKTVGKHAYCYYCITANRMADPNFNTTPVQCSHHHFRSA